MNGAYLLVLKVKRNVSIRVGSLGKINFKKGFYCYVGSALGKMSLEKRICRHYRLNRNKRGKIRWHIDYLLVHKDIELVSALYKRSKQKIECKLSNKIAKLSEFTVKKFGSTDCRCFGHLHFLGKDLKVLKLIKLELFDFNQCSDQIRF